MATAREVKQIRVDCSKCPILKEDCQWMADTLLKENNCPLLAAIEIAALLGKKGDSPQLSSMK